MTSENSNTSTSASQTVPRNAVSLRRPHLNSLMTPKVFPVFSLNELRNFDFAPPYDCTNFSWSPKYAFDARESGEVGAGHEWETLHTYLTDLNYRFTAADTLLEVNRCDLPNPGALMTIYRVTGSESGSDYGAILPGAAVSESIAHVQWFAEVYPSKKHKLLSTKVHPDELVTHGNPHEFIYIPRTLKVGFERYLADVKREQEAELARVRMLFSLLNPKLTTA